MGGGVNQRSTKKRWGDKRQSFVQDVEAKLKKIYGNRKNYENIIRKFESIHQM